MVKYCGIKDNSTFHLQWKKKEIPPSKTVKINSVTKDFDTMNSEIGVT